MKDSIANTEGSELITSNVIIDVTVTITDCKSATR